MAKQDERLKKSVEKAQMEAERYRNLFCSIRASSGADYERLKRKHILSHERNLTTNPLRPNL
jgi:hypothetical protein